MKTFIFLLISLAVAVGDALGESALPGITIHLAVQTNSVAWDTTHSSVTFMCKVTIHNQTGDTLTVTNLFQDHAGLSLEITDTNGKNMARLFAGTFKNPSCVIPVGGKASFWPYYGIASRFAVSEPNATLNIQLDGKLSGSIYSGSVTSDIAQLNVP